MSKKIEILGEVTPASVQLVKDALSDVNENDALEVEITSEGGDVFSGIQIANILARHKGKVTTHGVGLVASIATVILMAGDEVAVDSNAFCMIHNPWTMAIGNANDLQKEIDTLEKCKTAMMGYYRRHAKVDDATIEQYLDAESWFLGTELADVFDVRVIECDEVLDIAAKFDLSKFNNTPRGLSMKNKAELPVEEEEKKETTEETIVEEPSTTEEKKTEEQANDEEEKKEVVEEQAEEDVEEKSTDEEPEEPTVEELQKQIEELTKENEDLKARLAECEKKAEGEEEEEKPEEQPVEEEEEKKEGDEEVLNKAQVQARISGIQSSMQKQINDFKSQLKAKEEELIQAKADITRLNESLEKTTKELSDMASAFEEKQAALDKLNANVNAQAEELPTMNDGLAKCATPAEKVAFLKSGKYVR